MWQFKELPPGVPERDPHEAEFFRLTRLPEALVREVIQNSLDARMQGENLVRVCFTFGEVEEKDVREYVEGLEPHIKACDFPYDYSIPDRIPFDYLTIEDFGTTGLDGATGEDWRRPEERSNFYNFWWCEGKSWKRGREAGRWGLGKTTFHIVSKLRSFWGFTVRQDDFRCLLMGKALLKTHRIGDTIYQHSGYFAAKDYRPIADERVIRDFRRKFSVRRNKEPGLSLVIPMPDREINWLSLLRACIIHYFFAILKGILKVEIRESHDCVKLNADNLIDIACSQAWQDTSLEGVNVRELMEFTHNAIHSTDIFTLPIHDETAEISEVSFGDRLDALRNSFNIGNLLRLRIPVTIKEVNEPSTSTHFEVYLKKYPRLEKSEEFYIRSGITIPGIKMMGNRPVRGLLVAEDAPIVSFLGDSENPHHTEWNERTEGFKDKYDNAVRILRFVRGSMSKIVSILDQPPQERRRDFLKEIFFIPEVAQPEGEKATKTKVPVIERRPALFRITMIERGFRVSLARADISFPTKATVTVAYDVRRGNSFKQYDETSEKPGIF